MGINDRINRIYSLDQDRLRVKFLLIFWMFLFSSRLVFSHSLDKYSFAFVLFYFILNYDESFFK